MISALLLTVALALPATAATPPTVDPAVVQAKLQEAVTRLKLTPEQQAQLKPAFEESIRKLKAIRDAHGGDTSRAALRSMYRDARPVQEEFEDKVRAVLDDSQEVEWETMRKEARAKLKELRKSGKGPE